LSRREALIAAILSLGALLTAALFVPFDAPGLGRELVERLQSSAGIRLEFSRSTLRVLRGLLLEEAHAFAGSYDLRVPRLLLEHRPVALLRGGFELTGIRLDEARVGRATIEALRLKLSRLDYDPRAVTALHGVDTEGSLDIGRIVLATWELRELASRFLAEGGRLRFEELTLTTGGGALDGELALDFNTIPFRYRFALRGPSLEVYGVGRGELRLEASGFGTKPRDLEGGGTFAMARGRLPDAPWVREIDPSLAGAEHGPVEVPFQIRNERVYIERIELEAAGGVIEVEGSVGLDGSRDLRISKPS
jgi:hypothetical protein